MRAVLSAALVLIPTLVWAQDVTFTRDVAPVVFAACASCHRPNGPGPFSLTTYDEVRRRATQIAQVTRSRFMPPWKVEPGVGHFVGQRQLSDREIDLIGKWVKGGTPHGDPKLLPALPAFADRWLLGRPDLVVKPDAPFKLPAQHTDAFRIFAIRLPITQRTYVTGIEFHPGNARVVHHANIRIDRTDATRKLDDADPLPGYDGLMPRSAEYPDGHFLGWTPGQVAPLVSPELAWTLEPGSDLVVQLHMQPSGAVEDVMPEIGFYFSNRPPSKTPTILRIGSQGIDIPPGDSNYVVRDSYELPVDVQLLAIQPHAHYRAREIRGTARFPDGTSRIVMHIKDWDFRWQHVYRQETPIPLPKGTRLVMEYVYDNSADNPRNPELPPARVYWGQRSRDEMGDLWFQLLASGDADRERLQTEITLKMTAEDIIGYETMLKVTPNDAELRDDLAMLYLARGMASNAVRNFEISASLKPQSAAAHFNLGTALARAGRFNAAVESFQKSLSLRPDYAVAHSNLGRVLLAQGKTGDAIAHLERAEKLDPNNVPTLLGLADAYANREELDRAIEMIDRASRLPLTPEAANELRAKREAYVKRKKVDAPAPAQTNGFIVAEYLAPDYTAPEDAPPSAVIAGTDEPGERLVVSGRTLEGTKPVAGVSLFIFHTDADGLYAPNVSSTYAELHPRLKVALRTDREGRYRFETIRPGSYGDPPGASHVHYVVKAQGYEPLLLALQFEDDPVIQSLGTAATLLPDTDAFRNGPCKGRADCVLTRPVKRDAQGVSHVTRDIQMVR